LTVERLRCEYLVNPLGIDATSPRLGWVPQSSVRGQRQTAYQILAATDPQVLAADRGDLWDSGKVDSHESVHVLYGGQPLESGQRVYWKVRVWDRDGEPSSYSKPAWWEMGLLKPEDWRGQWLAAHPDRHQMLAPFDTARMRWIWWPEANPDAAPPKDQPRFFRRTFELPANRTITRAQLLLTGDDHYVLHINGQQVGTNDYWQMLRVYDLTAHLQPAPTRCRRDPQLRRRGRPDRPTPRRIS
jgi:alpha-L-rhamnosidase